MTDSLTYQQTGTPVRGQAHALFEQTMGYVAVTAGLFALGAWLGCNLTGGVEEIHRQEFDPPLPARDQAIVAFAAAVVTVRLSPTTSSRRSTRCSAPERSPSTIWRSSYQACARQP
jgi:hypothetical protein